MIAAPAIVTLTTEERIAALRVKAEQYKILEEKERCEESLSEFVRSAWSSIDSAPFMSCWAIDAMCLPYAAKIITSVGEKSIGEIVESKWMGNVLSFNHKTLMPEWKPILSHMKSVGKPLVNIKTSNTILQLTGNHPVFTKEYGYVKADQIKAGDVISLCLLQEKIQSQPWSESVLLSGMLPERSVKESSYSERSRLQALRETILSMPLSETWRILFSKMLGGVEETSRNNYMSKVWWPQSVGGGHLQSLLGKISPLRAISSMRAVWERCLEISSPVYAGAANIRSILQQKMFWIGDKGGKEYLLCKLETGELLPAGVLANPASYSGAGETRLFSLFETIKARCASYRSKYKEQQNVEFSGVVPKVPLCPARTHNKDSGPTSSYKTSDTVVLSIEKEIRIPDAVYNIEVIDNHNYFAEGILVHNCDHLENISLGNIKRLLINISPRTAKTSVCSIIFPAWVWARSQKSFLSGAQVKFLCASYNHALSLDSANKSRRLLFSPWYQKLWPGKIILQPDQSTKSQYDNTFGGSRISTSVGGSLLGLGADCVVADDLNKVGTDKTATMETDAETVAVENFWNELHSTRLNDPKLSAVIAVQQRTKEKDVSGLILDGDEDFVHLCVPMRHDEQRHCVTVRLPQYDDEEPWQDPRTVDGELMWPERFGETEVRKLENALGPFLAAGRLQQMPTPKGGGIIKRDWWQPWDQEEAQVYGLEWNGALKEFPHFELIVGSLDTSYGEKQENDYNALTIWGIWIDRNKNRRTMLMFAWNKRLPLHGKVVTAYPGEAKVNFEQRQRESFGLVEWVADTCKRYKVKRLLIENKTRGRDVANEINRLYVRENWGVELLEPRGDKVSRVHSVVPLFTDNAVWAPDTRWADLVITQTAAFPKADHDDLTDTVSMYLGWARENGLLVRADEMTASLEDDAAYKPQGQSVAQQYGV